MKLGPNATYHFRIVATSNSGTSRGADLTLTTGLIVTLNTSTSTVVFGRTVTLSGAVTTGASGQSVTLESKRFDVAGFSSRHHNWEVVTWSCRQLTVAERPTRPR